MPKSGENLVTIKGEVWRYPGPAGWHFVNMNRRDSARIRELPWVKTVAWGYVRIKATVGKTSWNTTLFPAKGGIYMVALKAAVRKIENIQPGDIVRIKIALETSGMFLPTNSKPKSL